MGEVSNINEGCMDKSSGKLFFIILIVFLILGCTNPTKSYTPTPDWRIATTFSLYHPPTNLSQYIHYVPSEGFEFNIEFDYPGYWWVREYSDEIGSKSVILGDPLILTVTTPFPGDSHPEPHDFGQIYIWIMHKENEQTPETELEEHKQSYNSIRRMKVLGDYQIEINGKKAAVLEYLTDDQETSPSIMFNRRVYFMVNDRVYEIIYSVANKDRGGEFDKGFDYFLNSMEFLE